MSKRSLDLKLSIQQGNPVFKAGVKGESNAAKSQFWATESPLNPGYADRYGIPPQLAKFDFILAGNSKEDVEFVTRQAPGVESNLGGGIEAVFREGDVRIDSFIDL